MAPLSHILRHTTPLAALRLGAAAALALFAPAGTGAPPALPLAAIETARPTDYAVIANYLAVFCRYVTWPAADPDTPASAPLRIGVLGPNPFGTTLDKVLAGKVLHGRPLAAVYATDIDQLAGCQVVFINYTETGGIAAALAALGGKPVLTVLYLGDMADSPATGTVIELVRVRSNVRYLLNPAALAAQRLQPTPGLLENALRRIGGAAP